MQTEKFLGWNLGIIVGVVAVIIVYLVVLFKKRRDREKSEREKDMMNR